MHLYIDAIPKKFFILIHRICTSSKAQAILAIKSSHTPQKRVRRCLNILSLFSLIPLVYFCNRSSTMHQTQRKISSIAKLFSTKLLVPLSCLTTICYAFPKIVFAKITFRWLLPEAFQIL
jgi:hypothetical protein